MRVGVRPSSPDQSLTLPELRPTFGRKLLDRERGSARHCGLNLLAHLSLGRSGTPLRGGGVLFRHAASLSGMSQLTAFTSQGTRSGSTGFPNAPTTIGIVDVACLAASAAALAAAKITSGLS